MLWFPLKSLSCAMNLKLFFTLFFSEQKESQKNNENAEKSHYFHQAKLPFIFNLRMY